jgi:hypothetical protein
MFRMIAIAAMLALAVPTLAAAEEHHPPGKPPPGRPAGGAKPFVAPHGPAGPHGPVAGPRGPGPRPALAGPHGPVAGPGGPGPRAGLAGPHGQFTYRGHPFNRVHLSPFVYPHGWGYRRWGIGMILPPLFLAPAYYYADWAAMGLPPPDPGFQWVRYGDDLLLVNVNTGEVVDVIYGAFS